MKPPRSRHGFTLLDLTIMLVILGIVGLIAVPGYTSALTAMRLDAAAAELVSALQYAANLAVTHERPFGVQADTRGNWFEVYDHRYRSDAQPHLDAVPPVTTNGVVLNPFDRAWYRRDFGNARAYQGVQITTAPSGGVTRFYPDGHSSESGTSYSLRLGGRTRTVSIDGTTANIAVSGS